MEKKYTGREIAIFADPHGLLEPTQAVIEDAKARGITEIYSLGDNIGLGPNPDEVIQYLEANGVISIAGNSEDYQTMGREPFRSYFSYDHIIDWQWTGAQLSNKSLSVIRSYPHFIELLVNGKKVALCHFANDTRCDFDENSTWSYQANLPYGNAFRQFLYTNSDAQIAEITQAVVKFGKDNPYVRGYLSAQNEPLFKGKSITFYDAVIQGHTHFKLEDKDSPIPIHSIRAVGMAYGTDPVDTASYVILREKTNGEGFDMEEVLVKYDRETMRKKIEESTNPSQKISKFTSMH